MRGSIRSLNWFSLLLTGAGYFRAGEEKKKENREGKVERVLKMTERQDLVV